MPSFGELPSLNRRFVPLFSFLPWLSMVPQDLIRVKREPCTRMAAVVCCMSLVQIHLCLLLGPLANGISVPFHKNTQILTQSLLFLTPCIPLCHTAIVKSHWCLEVSFSYLVSLPYMDATLVCFSHFIVQHFLYT
jgi:hypothetical protein